MKYQAQWKWPNRYSRILRLLPLFLHAQAGTQSHRSPSVYHVFFSFFFLIIQVFIDLYPLSGEEFNKNSSCSHSKYPLMECTHVLSPMMPEKWGIDEDLYKKTLCFPVTAQPDWLMCIPLGQRKTFSKFDTSFCLFCNSAICSGMWDKNKFHTHILQRPLYIMDACQNCVMMDARAKN